MEEFLPHTIQPGSEASLNYRAGSRSSAQPPLPNTIGSLGSATHAPDGEVVPAPFNNIFAEEREAARAQMRTRLNQPHPFAQYYNGDREEKKSIHLTGDDKPIPGVFTMGHVSRDPDKKPKAS